MSGWKRLISDLKMWNFAIKIIRSNLLSVCTFGSRPNRIRGIFSSTCMSLLISAPNLPTRKTGQLDTPKISEVMFLLHGCKNHTLEFLLNVSSTNNAQLVKVCAKSWIETIWVAYLLLLESVYRIFPPSSTRQKADSICTHFWAFDYIHLELSPVSK